MTVNQGQIMKGCRKNLQATVVAARHHSHHKDDVGAKDKYGFIYGADCKKTMMVAGGGNGYSR
ncbi:hypothetical protein [Desulfosoma caldarium]|uniref:hypothetical protein n=1 Tax=Desulfosoma caldarium TaxID=610254 RepID=UPI000F465D96|nr:hypothetical protein [Desulfosoma caldarium]